MSASIIVGVSKGYCMKQSIVLYYLELTGRGEMTGDLRRMDSGEWCMYFRRLTI